MCLNRLEIKNDILQSFDPRARLAAGVMLIIITVNVSGICALSVISAACLVLLRRDFPCVLKRLVPLETFCLLFLVQAAFGILRPYTAVIFVLRVTGAALIYMLTVIPLGAGKLAQTLAALKVNAKLVSIFYLSYRYIYMMHDRVLFSITAMRLRSAPSQKGIISVWKSYASVFSTALIGALVKTDEITRALKKREFDGVIPQTAVWAWSVKDTLLVVMCCAGCVIYGTYTITGRFFFL
jgi:energy-coupling factor transporter transmembrane protein EcfT